jgi:hypothetical protein
MSSPVNYIYFGAEFFVRQPRNNVIAGYKGPIRLRLSARFSEVLLFEDDEKNRSVMFESH